MAPAAPPARRRLVGRALRQYRETLGYTLDDAARMLECDRSKVSRVETGQRGICGEDLRELLGEYGVGDAEAALLELLANPRAGRGWFRDYEQVLRGAWLDYLTLETAASRISVYEAQRIPGLLQTPAYARALAEADPALKDDDARDTAVDAVLARQWAILEPAQADVHLIIGQAALEQEVGSAAVMDGQLLALARYASDSQKVRVQVLPFDAGAHAAVGDSSLAILQFDQAPGTGLGLVHLGGIAGGVCLEGRDDLAAYLRAFERLSDRAESPRRSAMRLRAKIGYPPS